MSAQSDQQYPWYTLVLNSTKITQGDIVENMPIPIIDVKDDEPYYKIGKGNLARAIVVTQACDLENDKIDKVALCPIVSITEVLRNIVEKELPEADYNNLSRKQKDKKEKIIDSLRQGHYLDYHLLEKYVGEEDSSLHMLNQVVLLRETFYLPVNLVNTLNSHKDGNRLSLLPPYREHLAQAYARNFHRIGLPIDIKINVSEV